MGMCERCGVVLLSREPDMATLKTPTAGENGTRVRRWYDMECESTLSFDLGCELTGEEGLSNGGED